MTPAQRKILEEANKAFDEKIAARKRAEQDQLANGIATAIASSLSPVVDSIDEKREEIIEAIKGISIEAPIIPTIEVPTINVPETNLESTNVLLGEILEKLREPYEIKVNLHVV